MHVEWNPDISNLQGKRKLIGSKNRDSEKSGVKLQCLAEEETTFGSSCRDTRKIGNPYSLMT